MKVKKKNSLALGASQLLKRLGWDAPALLAAVTVFVGPAHAQTIANSARQMAPGSLKFTAYYQGTHGQDLKFTLGSAGLCSGGGAINPTFACGSSGDTSADLDGGALILQATYQPWDSLQYYASVGAGNLRLEVSSVSVRNVVTGDRLGYLYAVGTRAILLPDTIVSPAFTFDGRLAWQRYYFNRLRPGTSPLDQNVDQRLDVYQYQVALETSHRFEFTYPKWSIEPYGGLKWLRSHSYLKDLNSGGRVGGIQDAFTPFLGLLLPVYEHEGLMFETSFVGGVQYAAGLQVRF